MSEQRAWAQPQFVPPPLRPVQPVGPNRLNSLPTLSILMIVHGSLVLLWVAFCVFAILIGLINVGFISSGRAEDAFVIVIYTVFGLAALPVAIVNIVGGARVRKLRSKRLAIGALIAGGVSFFCGNIFCMPLTVGVLIYGIMILTDARVSAAFARVAAGEPAERVLAEP
jgi:hypothetical protein